MRNKSDGMNRSLTFTLQDTELTEAYQFLASLLPRNKMRHLAIELSVPVLALFLIYFHAFRLDPHPWTQRLMDFKNQPLALDNLSA